MTAIFIPTYARPGNMRRVAESIRRNTLAGYAVYFIVEGSDYPSLATAQELGIDAIVNTGRPTYASCINTAYHQTSEQFFFCGADDLSFHPSWLPTALQCMGKGIDVVGTNDLHNPDVLAGNHATHYLVKRSYIKKYSGVVDQPDTVLHDYDHNYTDTEFIETAKARGAFLSCRESKVEHLHWCWGLAAMDETYKKGFSTSPKDKAIFEERRRLWESA